MTTTCEFYNVYCWVQWSFDQFYYLFEWLVNQLTGFLLFLDDKFTSMVHTFMNSIQVPSFVGDAQNAFAGIPPGVTWFTNVFELEYGLGIFITALVIRFTIRRIPLIG